MNAVVANAVVGNAGVLIAGLVIAPLFGWALAFERWYVATLLVVMALTPALIRWPTILTFGVYVFLIPFDSISTIADAGGSSVTRLIGILCAAVLLIDGVVVRRRLVRPPLAALWWGLFVLWSALSAAWALDPSLVFRSLPTAASLFLLYAVAALTKPSRQELLVICMLAVLGGVIAAGVTYFNTDTTHTLARGTLAIEGRTANPNRVAAVLIFPLALAIGGCVAARGIVPRAAAMTAVGLIGMGIYITAARQAVVAIIAMVVFFIYRFRGRRQILIVVAVLLALVAVMPEAVTDRIETIFTGEDKTGSGRTKIWEIGIAALERFGVFGAGLSSFTTVFNVSSPYGPSRGPAGAHNAYLAAWVELGIVGLLLILVAIGSQLWALHRSKLGADDIMIQAIQGACLGMLVIAFFQDILWSKEFWLVWIMSTWANRIGVGLETKHRALPRMSLSTRGELLPGQAGDAAIIRPTNVG